jgi:hypothetical protein
MPFTFTLDAVPIGWAELLVIELEGNQTRDHSAVGWGELHPYQSFEELRSLLLINRAARSGPAGYAPTKLHGIGKLELFGPSGTPIPTRSIYLNPIRPGSYVMAYVTFASAGASIAGAIPPVPRQGLNAAKIGPTEADRTSLPSKPDARETD